MSGDSRDRRYRPRPGRGLGRSWPGRRAAASGDRRRAFLGPCLAGLTERLRVIRYDARGYGRSPSPTQEFRHLDDLTAVLDQLAVPSANLVGCSMSGANAIDLALASPERVPALIECDEAVAARIPGCELIRMPGVDPSARNPRAGLVAQTILRQVERASS